MKCNNGIAYQCHIPQTLCCRSCFLSSIQHLSLSVQSSLWSECKTDITYQWYIPQTLCCRCRSPFKAFYDLVSSAVHSTFPSLSIQSSPFFLSPHFLPSVNVSRPNIHLHLHLLLLLCNCTGAFLYLVYLVDILDILSTRRPNLHLLLHHSVLLQRCKVCQFLNIFLNNLMISTHQPPQHPPPPESPAAFLNFSDILWYAPTSTSTCNCKGAFCDLSIQICQPKFSAFDGSTPNIVHQSLHPPCIKFAPPCI